mmetsp:Transcript_20043/g.35781  ORF Transcript_20043/g.35781 Transcript_20043/m.35781 type:complete len:333 (-) Transcript_20043:467-1465(-)
MYLMYFCGLQVVGPSWPSKCNTRCERRVNSQSSMNSQRCSRPSSLACGMVSIILMMASTIDFLKSYPPSSRRASLKKLSNTLCLWGNFTHRSFMASITTILNSSAMSLMKLLICFIKRSMLNSLPVLRRVVMAKVAIFRLGSEISDSMSMLQVVTASGCVVATLFSRRTAANRRTGLWDVRYNWRTRMAGVKSLGLTVFNEQMHFAASNTTISLECFNEFTTNWLRSGDPSKSSFKTSVHIRINKHNAIGDRMGVVLTLWTNLETDNLSFFRSLCSSASAWYCAITPRCFNASPTSPAQRFTSSGCVYDRWMPVTIAADETTSALSTTACAR